MTRLSLGAQSLDDTELRRLGRRHRAADVASAVNAARDAGIASISLDLLYDIPGATLADWTATLEAALALEPDHLSLYALTLDDPDAEGLTGPSGDHLPTTPGAINGGLALDAPGRGSCRGTVRAGHPAPGGPAGWRGYEISNWARPGHESRHNLAYWERRPYEAVGPGAHAFDGATRRWNAARLEGYLAALAPADGAARDSRRVAARPWTPPPRPRSRSSWASGPIAGAAGQPSGSALRRGIPVGARQRPGRSSTRADRVVLTTRGRLLSNELFARLV